MMATLPCVVASPRPVALASAAIAVVGERIFHGVRQVIDSCDDTERIVSAFLFLVASGAECLLSAYQNELSGICGCRLRAVLQGAIFKKMTLLSPSARAAISTGQVLSILGVDCYQLAMSIFNFPYPVCGLLCMPIMLYLLACRVGAATPLCCAGYLLFVFLLPIPISRMQNFLWFRQMRARDERLKQTSDLLSSVRLVKMYAWEDAYKDKLLRARDVEMKPLFWVNVLDGLIDSIYSASSSVLIIIFFGTLAIFNPGVMLPSSVVFSCVYMIFITDVPMTQTSMALRVRSQVRV
ncbi:ATP-binding cassette sub-family C member 2 [Ixodes scapularis]